jgi:hypothetical protein
MQGLLSDFLGPGSPIKVRDELPPDTIERMPLLYFAHRLLGELAENEIKLTQKGNLPGKLVKAYYATQKLPDSFVERGISTIRGEDDYLPLQVVKYILKLAGWTKKRHGKLSLTKKGRTALALSPEELFGQLFLVHQQRINLGYWDGYAEEAGQIQRFTPYLLYLLLLRGKTKRDTDYYRERMLRAFPMLGILNDDLHGRAMETRLLGRLLELYGLVDYQRGNYKNHHIDTVQTTELFHDVFYLDPEARMTPPTEEERYETQLQSALFDAEMGSNSWVSDELPPEVLERFQANIRAYEERHQAGETTPVGALIGELPLLPPDEVTDETIAEREITRLLAALEQRGVITDRADAIPAADYYRFLVERLLEHEIVPPLEGQQVFVSTDDVFLAGRSADELTTQGFLLMLFKLDEPFPAEILHEQMRLGQQVVSRQQGLAHLNAWRRQYQRIDPLSFDIIELPPGQSPAMPPGQSVCFFGVEYLAVHPDGREEHFRGEGVVELVLGVGREWAVSGGMFPGFAF